MSLDRAIAALQLIATPKRPDGTWNRDREACRQLAAEVLAELQLSPLQRVDSMLITLAKVQAALADIESPRGDSR